MVHMCCECDATFMTQVLGTELLRCLGHTVDSVEILYADFCILLQPAFDDEGMIKFSDSCHLCRGFM